MTADTKHDVDQLLAAGRIVREAFERMKAAAAARRVRPPNSTRSPRAYFEDARRALRAAGDVRLSGRDVHQRQRRGRARHSRSAPARAGDMVNIDVSAELNGYIADMGESFVLAPAAPVRARICRAVRHAVTEALRRVRAGRSLNVIGHTVQRVADRYGYRIVGNLASHGVGRSLHEEPSYVPHNNPRERRVLERGMVLTIEPFFTTDADDVVEMDDGWTLTCGVGELVAQFEQTLIVTDGAPIIVTA